jgi:hypothetical protein
MWFLSQIFLFVSCSHSLQHVMPPTSTALATHGTGRRGPGALLHQNAPTLVLECLVNYVVPSWDSSETSFSSRELIARVTEPRWMGHKDRLHVHQGWRTYGTQHSLTSQIFVFCPTSICEEGVYMCMCVCVHQFYCVQLSHELQLLPNIMRVRHFYKNLRRQHGGDWANT